MASVVNEQALSHQQATALYVSAFFDELVLWGVREVVISPGSRSTALAMCAYEMSCRFPEKLRIYVDVDERGASFFALGLAKASGRPVALVCTSGTALANYYPAVIEAATSRVPLIVLSGDRPMQLQGVGAPQTCDQLKAYGDYVRRFQQMPEPGARAKDIAFVRQAAREAVLAAMGPGGRVPGGLSEDALRRPDGFSLREGAANAVALDGSCSAKASSSAFGHLDVAIAARGCAHLAGPVHLNFPFDEPLKPDFSVAGLFEAGRRVGEAFDVAPLVAGSVVLDAQMMSALMSVLASSRVLVLAGEGTCETVAEARAVIAWAQSCKLPLLADPLSGLRGFADECIIDNYDNVFRTQDAPVPDTVIRFGRYPISKPTNARLAAAGVRQIVIDAGETRDWNFLTDAFVACTPLDFARQDWGACSVPDAQAAFFDEWVERNRAARCAILSADSVAEGNECAFVRKLCELIPAGSCLFSANSMAIRAVDTFLVKEDKPVVVLCNRGQNGIDGTVSTALGAAQCFRQTTFLTGDFTMLHDLNALALQRELRVHHGVASGEPDRSVVIVLLNNNGGAIFDMLPQQSDDPYFERLFLVPQDVDFERAAAAFSVPYKKVRTVADFAEAYEGLLGKPGISLIEVEVPLRGVKERYANYHQ